MENIQKHNKKKKFKKKYVYSTNTYQHRETNTVDAETQTVKQCTGDCNETNILKFKLNVVFDAAKKSLH